MGGVSLAAQASEQDNPYTVKDVIGRTKNAFVGGAALGALYEGAGSAAGNLTYSDLNILTNSDLRSFNKDLTKAYTQNLKEATDFTDEQIKNYVDEAMKDKSRAGTINRILGLQEELGVKTEDFSVNTQAVNDNQIISQSTINENTIVPSKVDIQTNARPVNVDMKNIMPNAQIDQTAAGNRNIDIGQKSSVNQNKIPESLNLKEDLTSNDIQKILADKKIFSDQQLDNMNERQLYHVLRTLSFDYEGKIPDIYNRVLSFKGSGDMDGMKSFVKELQGFGANNIVLQSGGDSGRINTSNEASVDTQEIAAAEMNIDQINEFNKEENLQKLTKQNTDDKLARYLLNLEHPIGGNKAKWFRDALGFTQKNADELACQIVFNSDKAIQTSITKHGIKYNQIISIKGANGKIIDVTFAWIKNNDGVIRLITGIPTKK